MAGRYDPKILKRVQEYELEILKDFIKVCEENDLTYFGAFGTAIGAVRHGGFIPWDDDIDVCMLRDDYNKVLEIFRREYADKYTVGDPETCEDYCMISAHISLNDTFFCEENAKHLNIPKGIFMDIFPIDNVPDDQNKRKRHLRKIWWLNKLMIIEKIPNPIVPYTGLLKCLIFGLFAVMRLGMKAFNITHRRLYSKILKYCETYSNQQTQCVAYCADTYPAGIIFQLEDLFPLKVLSFEGIDVLFPYHNEKVLADYYGDYMQLPPEEKRHNHCPDYIKFPGEDLMINMYE